MLMVRRRRESDISYSIMSYKRTKDTKQVVVLIIY